MLLPNTLFLSFSERMQNIVVHFNHKLTKKTAREGKQIGDTGALNIPTKGGRKNLTYDISVKLWTKTSYGIPVYVSLTV